MWQVEEGEKMASIGNVRKAKTIFSSARHGRGTLD